MANRQTTGRQSARQLNRPALRKVFLVDQAKRLGERAAGAFAQQLGNLLGPLPIVTKREVARIDRRVMRLNRKLCELKTDSKPRTPRGKQSPRRRRSRKKA